MGDEAGSSSDSGSDGSASTGTAPGPLDGVWQTEGYGWIYAVEGPDISVFEATSETCVQVVRGTILSEDTGEGARADLEVPGLFTLGMTISEGDEGELYFLADGLILAPEAHDIEALPASCSQAPDAGDVAVFDTVTRWFDEHYALFDDRDVDWSAMVSEERARLTSDSPSPLLEVLTSLLGPLEDAHVSIQGPEGTFEGRRVEVDSVTETMVEQGQALISKAYLVTERESWVAGQIEFARLPGDVGYLAAHGFGPLVGEDGRLDYLAAVEEFRDALDVVFSDDTMRAVVVDLRTNGGGSDLYGLELASRFADTSYTAYSIRARIDPVDESVFGPPHPIVIEPSERPSFDGPVAVLIGRGTISAGETAALALRGRPGISIIGESSQGAFSSVLNHFLPNGWLLGLPNEHYLTEGGERFDVVGIPPDVETPVFSAEDLEAGRDSAIEAAIASFD